MIFYRLDDGLGDQYVQASDNGLLREIRKCHKLTKNLGHGEVQIVRSENEHQISLLHAVQGSDVCVSVRSYVVAWERIERNIHILVHILYALQRVRTEELTVK